MTISSRLTDRIRRIAYCNWGRHFGFGCKVSKTTWEEQYRDGVWDILKKADAQEHYQAVAEFCSTLSTSPSILDVGCGEALLYKEFKRANMPISNYLGIDISSNAVKIAAAEFPETHFVNVNAEEYLPPSSSFHLIIFNESIYYFKHPIDILNQYKSGLTPSGFFVITMCDFPGHASILARIKLHYKCIRESHVTNSTGHSTHIAAFARSRILSD
jgi:SAM-dependent methyltransferase